MLHRTIARFLLFASVLGGTSLVVFAACDREKSAPAQEAPEDEQLPSLVLSLQLTEGVRQGDAVVGESTATLTIERYEATLTWSHSGQTAGDQTPPSGTVKLSGAQGERIVQILQKTALDRSLTVGEVLQSDGRFATLQGHVTLAGERGDFDVVINEGVPLDAHDPTGKDGVFKVDAARTLIAEVARALGQSDG